MTALHKPIRLLTQGCFRGEKMADKKMAAFKKADAKQDMKLMKKLAKKSDKKKK